MFDHATLTPIPTPTPPPNATNLPAPSGGNDTAAIQSAIAAGGDFVGSGTYKLSNLRLNRSVRIWNMPSTPASGADLIGTVTAPDVQIYNSLIDGQNQSGFRSGWDVQPGGDRFVLVNSGLINVRNTKTAYTFGVRGVSVEDIHIGCSEFSNLISENSPVRGLVMTGATPSKGGAFINNFGYNHQATNNLRDADIFVPQGFVPKQFADRPFMFMANRFTDAGKRMVKLQVGNVRVYSNAYHWDTDTGPLGPRLLLVAINFWTSNNIARNNHIIYSANSRMPEKMVVLKEGSFEKIENTHVNCNLFEYQTQPPTNTFPSRVVYVDNTGGGNASQGTTSTFTDNVIRGPGRPSLGFTFVNGWGNNGASYTRQPNIWEVQPLIRMDQ